jgi:hypothetical protein
MRNLILIPLIAVSIAALFYWAHITASSQAPAYRYREQAGSGSEPLVIQSMPNRDGSNRVDLPADVPSLPLDAGGLGPPPASNGNDDPFEKQRLEIERNLRSIPSRYNIPERLTYGQSVEISFVLEPQGVGTGARLLENTPGKIETDVVRVSPQVKAILSGPRDLVEIKLRGGDEAPPKAVTLVAPTQWVWDVKAIGGGMANLQIELISFIKDKDKQTSFQITTFRRQIPIEISLVDRAKLFVADITPIWAFLGTVATGLAGLLAYFGWKPSPARSGEGATSTNPKERARHSRRNR